MFPADLLKKSLMENIIFFVQWFDSHLDKWNFETSGNSAHTGKCLASAKDLFMYITNDINL